MDIKRYIYLNVPDIASLHSQLHGEDVIETLITTEHSRTTGLKLALAAFLGGSIDSGAGSKDVMAKKVTKRPENLLREIIASLRAQGVLQRSIENAKTCVNASKEPSWFEARHPFSMPFDLHECNGQNRVVFLSGQKSDQIEMSASLHHFPGAREGILGMSSHDALLFKAMKGGEREFSVFGSLFSTGNGFQIKPVAIAA